MKLVLVDLHPSIGGAAHDMTKESVMNQLLTLAARLDRLATALLAIDQHEAERHLAAFALCWLLLHTVIPARHT